ncbi:MAG: hydroxyacid dehydrogenase [Jiangellaceae bacterium]
MRSRGIYLLSEDAFETGYGEAERSEIARLVDVHPVPLTAETVVRSPDLSKADIVFSGWGAPVMDEAFLASAPRVRMVFYGAGSVRSLVTDAFWDRGIRVTSAAEANAIPVSEYTLAAILLSLKHVWRLSAKVRAEHRYPALAGIPGAFGSTVGILSFGAIGRLVCSRLRSFDVRVIAYDPYTDPKEAARLGVELVPLDAVFRECDVVSLHTPWLRETEGLVGRALLSLMKEGATLINTARGAVVREQDLIDVLRRRPDLTAVVDVTDPEPPQPGSPLYSLPNVVLTPHIAGSQGRERLRMGRCMVQELHRYLEGEPLEWEITRDEHALLT